MKPLATGFKQVLIEPLVAHRSVLPFNVSILLRFAWLDVLKLNASFSSPGCQRVTDVFRRAGGARLPFTR